MSQPVIIFTNGGGRLSNQLLNCAHLFAWACEYNYGLINLAFWPFGENYSAFNENPIISINNVPDRYKKRLHTFYKFTIIFSQNNQRRLNKLFRQYLRLLGKLYKNWGVIRTKDYTDPYALLDKIDLSDKTFNKEIQNKKTTILSGWNIRSWSILEKNASVVRNLLTPNLKISNKGDELINSLRIECDLIVGIFIRQGDYRTWMSGKYYFTIEQYNKWCLQILNNFPDKRITFLVSGEEKIERSEFNSELNIQFSTGSANCGGTPFHTHYELSKCDLIASPPSTFSAWAAFMGKIPLIPLIEDQIDFTGYINSLTEAAIHPHFKYAVN